MHWLFQLIPSTKRLWSVALWLVIFSSPSTLALSQQPSGFTSSLPLIEPVAMIQADTVLLKPIIHADKISQAFSFSWQAADANPASVSIYPHKDGTAYAFIPKVEGEYYFTLTVKAGAETAHLKTYVIRNQNGLTAFDLQTMKASWINKAIIYQVTPSLFVKKGTYRDIEAKLPELVDLGINTLYLQPVFKTKHGGQGYDIIDYFSIRTDLGTEEDLRSLVTKAKALHLRVLFDMVPNHTSIYHPYALDKVKNGAASSYFDYYQHAMDGAKYASNYHQHPDGFIYYFWKDLVNLNYDNEKVQQWIIDACKYWIQKFDIDGYRFDAVWGVNARAPLFGKRLQVELKSIKPDLFLLAEDKASAARVYRQGFDAAYDWAADTAWISHWSWQYAYDDLQRQTLFNHPSVSSRKSLLEKALFSDGDSVGLRLRFLENNDQHRFITNHSLEVTKMAATLLVGLSGIPMLYNGQEVGCTAFPYTSTPIFRSDTTIRSLNPELFDFYKRLLHVRKENDVFSTGTLSEIPCSSGKGVVAFLRSNEQQKVIAVTNLAARRATIKLRVTGLTQKPATKVRFNDLYTGHSFFSKIRGKGRVKVPIAGYTTRLLLLYEQK